MQRAPGIQTATTTSAGAARRHDRVDGAAWNRLVEQLYRDEFGGLCRAALRFVDTPHAAEEVVQESFVRFATMSRRPRPGSELSYLRSIVMNEARSTLRRRMVAAKYADLEPRAPATDGIGDLVAERHEATAVLQLLTELPLRQRQVLTLRHLHGLSEREIARALSISAGSVKTHASRAVAAMRLRAGVAA